MIKKVLTKIVYSLEVLMRKIIETLCYFFFHVFAIINLPNKFEKPNLHSCQLYSLLVKLFNYIISLAALIYDWPMLIFLQNFFSILLVT